MFTTRSNEFAISRCVSNAYRVGGRTMFVSNIFLDIVHLFVVIVVFTSKKFLQQRYRYVECERVFIRCVLINDLRSQCVWLLVFFNGYQYR